MRLSSRDRARFDHFRERFRGLEPRYTEVAGLDVLASAGDAGAAVPLLGLVTIGRLLGDVEPHRSRWALQHLPYPVAKLVRPRMGANTSLVSRRELVVWESDILDAVLDRMRHEGLLAEGDLA